MYFCAFREHYDYCENAVNTPEALFLHIQIYHNDLTNYTCGQVGCNRTFERLDSFKRHVRSHASQLPIRLPIDNGVRPSNEEHCSIDIELFENERNLSNESISLPPENVPINENIGTRDRLKKLEQNFLSKLYLDSSLSRTSIQKIIDNISDLLSNIGTVLESEIIATNNAQHNFGELANFLNNPFSDSRTEYKRMQSMKEAGYYVAPKQIFIGQRINDIVIDNRVVRVPVKMTLTFIPLRNLFKTIFSSPKVFQITHAYINNQHDDEIIEDVIHTPFWKNKQRQFFTDKFVIPLHLYYDEFECNNPLGSHAGIHKIGAVYVSLRCFPLQLQSRLSTIFLALLVHYQDIVSEGNEIFRVLVEELIFLENEGISIDLGDGMSRKIYFSLAMILGDNAGLNAMLGYASCASNYFCRICKGHKRDLLTSIQENEHFLRTPENYDDDVAIGDFRLTGIKENSIFNEIPSFHVVNNNAVDIMHDLLEGVCKYDMTLVLIYYTTVRMISLRTINSCIQSFDYGYIEFGNKPPIITDEALRKRNINMSAAEMMCLVRNFGLMVGHLIPEDDNAWRLYCSLCDILDIVLAPSYQVGTQNLLKVLVDEHHELYLETIKLVPCFESELFHLKPKFHYMVHYWRIINNYGPLRNFWCMRFEGKHTSGKRAARNSASRINICQTIAIDHQLRLAYMLLSDNLFDNIIQRGPRDTSVICEIDDQFFAFKWISYNGHLFKSKKCAIRVDTQIDDLPQFGFVMAIFSKSENNEILIYYQNLRTLGYDNHRRSYIVELTEVNVYKKLLVLPDSTPLYLRNVENIHYVTLPYQA